jgi:hypothetical protein
LYTKLDDEEVFYLLVNTLYTMDLQKRQRKVPRTDVVKQQALKEERQSTHMALLRRSTARKSAAAFDLGSPCPAPHAVDH